MEYINDFNNFKESKINEEFIGKLIKKAKDSLSIGFSKMFGSAKKVNKLIDEYTNEVMEIWTEKRDSLKKLNGLIKSDEEKGKEIEEEINRLKEIDENYKEQKKLLKQKFDIKFKDIEKNEKKDSIKNYIILRKIELQQSILKQELDVLVGEANEKDIENDYIKNAISNIKKEVSDFEEKKEKEEKKLKEAQESDKKKFNMDEAMENPSDYINDNSEFLEYSFSEGEKMLVWLYKVSEESDLDSFTKSKKEYKGTELFYADEKSQEETKDGEIAVSKDGENLDKWFSIDKKKIIKLVKDE